MKHTQNFTADPAAAFAKMMTEEHLVGRYEAAGSRNISITKNAETADGGWELVCSREVPANVPGFAKKFLSEWNTIQHSETWSAAAADGARTGSSNTAVDGAPIKMSSTMSLTASGGGSANEIALKVDVSIPLVGKKIAALVEEDIHSSLDKEESYLNS